MHEVLHVSVLGFTILGAASLALLVLWPALFDSAMPPVARGAAAAAVLVAGALFLLEWQVVH
jgi:hypothetical protein